MGIFYFRCRSVTYAQRAVKTLERSGISCSVVKLPQHLSEDGCGYGIRINGRWLNQALGVLHDAGFEIRNIYTQNKNGEFKEVTM